MHELNSCSSGRVVCVFAVATALCAVVTAACQLSTLNQPLSTLNSQPSPCMRLINPFCDPCTDPQQADML
jgi:hypothetical protein